MRIRRGRRSRPPCTGSKNVLAVKVRLAHRDNTGKKDEDSHDQLRSRSSRVRPLASLGLGLSLVVAWGAIWYGLLTLLW
jgi:hypothetical protein